MIRVVGPAGLALLLSRILSPTPLAGVTFTEVSREAGINFTHVTGASGEKYYVETMGSGACWLDHDGDGDVDLYVVNSAELPGYTGGERPTDRLFRNDGAGKFSDVTAEAGVVDRGYGMGCTAGDIDNDGDTDLYVTNFGPNVMYRNVGGGRFEDVTDETATGDPRWSASAAFGDIDADGDLDLYVTNYIDFTLDNNVYCGQEGIRAYCHPEQYNGVPDSLYLNLGDGRFEDVAEKAGVANPIGKGLGVVLTDIDDDGRLDIYVANDKTINFLYHNLGDGTFEDLSLTAGTGFSESGLPQAGMGTDAGDLNGDGRMDLIVTNLDFETNELYLNNGDLTFTNATFSTGLGDAFLPVGFGADFLDHDNDGDKDLLVVNGHILDNISLFKNYLTYAQERSMMRNEAGRLREVGDTLGPDFTRPQVGRGLAVADMDDDGDLDLFVVNSGSRAELLRNDQPREEASYILVKLAGTKSNRAGIGARVRVMTRDAEGAEHWQVDETRAGSSYLSCHDPRLHFGLGRSKQAEKIEVRWPSGILQTLVSAEANRLVTIVEPER